MMAARIAASRSAYFPRDRVQPAVVHPQMDVSAVRCGLGAGVKHLVERLNRYCRRRSCSSCAHRNTVE